MHWFQASLFGLELITKKHLICRLSTHNGMSHLRQQKNNKPTFKIYRQQETFRTILKLLTMASQYLLLTFS